MRGEEWERAGRRPLCVRAAAAVHLEGAVEVADVEAVAVELALEGGVAALRLAVDDLEHVVQSKVCRPHQLHFRVIGPVLQPQ